jgi:hypothetical protein
MWYFFTSPETGLLIGLALIIFLIATLIKSAGSKLFVSVDKAQADENWRKYKETVGPMSWQERIFMIVVIVLFVAFVVWLANVT